MLNNFLLLIRPNHWIKNGFVFLPLVFSKNLLIPQLWMNALIAFCGFCLISSAIYILNDVADAAADKLHPEKRKRPIASGKIKKPTALVFSLVLAALSFAISYPVLSLTYPFMIAYLLINVLYSLWLKHLSIVDCMCVASGFVLRVMVGCAAIEVTPSDWILTVTFFLALFLSFSKRKSELLQLQQSSEQHRKVLSTYSIDLLNNYILTCGIITIAAYLLYTVDEDIVAMFQTSNLKYSVVFVVAGFFRYFQLAEQRANRGADPTYLILNDIGLQLSVIGWIGSIVIAIYG